MTADLSWETDPHALVQDLADKVAEAASCEAHARAEFTDLMRFYSSELWQHHGIPAPAVDAAINTARSTLAAYTAGRGHAQDRLDQALAHPEVARRLQAAAPGAALSLMRERIVAQATQRRDSNVDIALVAVERLIAAHDLDRDR